MEKNIKYVIESLSNELVIIHQIIFINISDKEYSLEDNYLTYENNENGIQAIELLPEMYKETILKVWNNNSDNEST